MKNQLKKITTFMELVKAAKEMNKRRRRKGNRKKGVKVPINFKAGSFIKEGGTIFEEQVNSGQCQQQQ